MLEFPEILQKILCILYLRVLQKEATVPKFELHTFTLDIVFKDILT